MKKTSEWFKTFIDDCCVVDKSLEEKSANLYTAYINYCLYKLKNTENTKAFYRELENMNFTRTTHKRVKYFKGIKLTNEAYDMYITLGTRDFVKERKKK